MKKNYSRLLLPLLLVIPFSMAQAQIFPPLTNFNSSTGVLTSPALIFEGKVYYVQLSVVDAAALTMKIEASTLVDVSPTDATSSNTTSDILGTWTVSGEGGTTFTFNEDATWEMSQAAGLDAEACPDGGIESGTFRFAPSTAVFAPIFLTDENGECGLSNSGSVIRMIPDGNTMTVMIGNETAATLVKN